MSDIKNAYGERLKEVRMLMNSGKKLSGAQFAYLVGESSDKIKNYELSRTIIPVDLLEKLYNVGINPMYIILGEGNYFANNSKGIELKEAIIRRSEHIDSKVLSRVGSNKKTGT